MSATRQLAACWQPRDGAHPQDPAPPPLPPAPLLLDLYELTMAQSYFQHGMVAPATFSLFVRRLPPGWGYLLAAGLDDVLAYLEGLAFDLEEIVFLRRTGLFSDAFLAALYDIRFTGSVRALPEGTVCFPDEPLLEVTAPIAQAQLVETMVVNEMHLQTLAATKAARCVAAAAGRRLVDFGLRRAHGADAGLKVARSAYLAGFDATSNVLAGQRYGIPVAGTMAHSYVQAFPDELAAFRAYARSYPDSCVLLVDTYDSVRGTRLAAVVGQELAATGHRLRGIRLDSGDMVALSRECRAVLDAAGLQDATIFASSGFDEAAIAATVASGAPIDAFGVGTKLAVCADAPALDMVYKLVAYDGRPALKLSPGKATWPGPKQMWRTWEGGVLVGDLLAGADEPPPHGMRPLLQPVMRHGRRLRRPRSPSERGTPLLAQARARARRELAALPAASPGMDAGGCPPVRVSHALRCLRDQLRLEARGALDSWPRLVLRGASRTIQADRRAATA